MGTSFNPMIFTMLVALLELVFLIKEHYRSPMFPGDKWNKDFDKDYADCLWRFSDELHLVDY